MALNGLGGLLISVNQLHQAAKSYGRMLELVGDQQQPVAVGGHLGLARIFYEWNDLESAQEHLQQALQLARQIDSHDAFAQCAALQSRVGLA